MNRKIDMLRGGSAICHGVKPMAEEQHNSLMAMVRKAEAEAIVAPELHGYISWDGVEYLVRSRQEFSDTIARLPPEALSGHTFRSVAQ